jgi:hypothetical protein
MAELLFDMISTLGGHFFRIILPLLPLVFSFACGYGLREFISRRRRAAAREEFFRRHQTKDPSFEPLPIAPPNRLHSRAEVLSRPSRVPAKHGLYAWYFSDVPQAVPTEGCLTVDEKKLLYIGSVPDKASKPNSRQSLLRRIRYHYKGNAEGSPLRRTLGVLLEEKSKFPLRRVGKGKRITLTRAGERYLDEWMERNAFVAWMACPEPWILERELLSLLSCPLNLKGNNRHPFAPVLKRLRSEALRRARELPKINE